jgi:hypothetical protein
MIFRLIVGYTESKIPVAFRNDLAVCATVIHFHNGPTTPGWSARIIPGSSVELKNRALDIHHY